MIEVYTDGSCLGNPGKGGWAFLVIYKDKIITKSGYSDFTTNNQMELTAAIKALHYLKEHNGLIIFTDSNYLKDGINLWIKNWKKNNWLTSQKKPVKNQNLWKKLDELISDKKISWHWVKGHSINSHNNTVDEMARKAAESK